MWLRFTRAASEKRTREVRHSDRLHLTSPKTPLACRRRSPQFVPAASDISRNRHSLEIVSRISSSVESSSTDFRDAIFSYHEIEVVSSLSGGSRTSHASQSRSLRELFRSLEIGGKCKYDEGCIPLRVRVCTASRRAEKARIGERERNSEWKNEGESCGATSRLDESTKF